MPVGLKNNQITGLITHITNELHTRFRLPQMLRDVIAGIVVDYLVKEKLMMSDKVPGGDFPITLDSVRAEFERQHKGRRLDRHYLRETYTSPQIAALWNQHIKTLSWVFQSIELTEEQKEKLGKLE